MCIFIADFPTHLWVINYVFVIEVYFYLVPNAL